MAKPNKKGPMKTVSVLCAKCKTLLYKYRKRGKGALVKCFIERITENYTVEKCTCPNCQSLFAREALIRGTPAYKMIGGKVLMK